MTKDTEDEGTTERDFSIDARMVTLTRQQPTTAEASGDVDAVEVGAVVVEELPPTFVDRDLGVVMMVREPESLDLEADSPGATRVDPNLRNVAALLLRGKDGHEQETERARPLPLASVTTSVVGGEPVAVERFVVLKK